MHLRPPPHLLQLREQQQPPPISQKQRGSISREAGKRSGKDGIYTAMSVQQQNNWGGVHRYHN
ncbi:uncharacterized protein KY384_002846 [Bacidia gigantensis]|uniref:uncharacterized protein n=1 Tax=Bacidia gigantensis TaxID=2732470 RepID=UPI001D04ECC1|nr:uncharacterized protein KY384_002846 [Bacidia gigantensis]KAG8532361.1 hypothetical protein KY384_002846 [Bacidia gigantensis]